MAQQPQFDNFNVTQNGYAAFDATSLRNLIIQRLNTNAVFTDQNYEGSNLSSLIDIIAYSYHVLLFYLNQTSSESLFSQATLYENVNKIVSILNYKPIGIQTAILSFNASSTTNLPLGTYTIPRYSYFTVNGINYSFNADITFSNTVSGSVLTSLQDQTTLFQGSYIEYPLYTATGIPYETITLTVVDTNGNNALIDHSNIDVYVKDNTQLNPTWKQYSSTPSLFLENTNAEKYEIRLNENDRYEIKFGNNITGKQLNAGDNIAIYYLKSDGVAGEISSNILNGSQLFFYNSPQFINIQANTTVPGLNLLTTTQASYLNFTNTNGSTQYSDKENVDSIKTNAVNTFQSQYRLITITDIENYIVQNFSNIICSVVAINNFTYLNGHVAYLLNLGANQPTTDSRVLLNQIKFATNCNFNNIYVYAVPNVKQITSLTTRTNYLNTSQKQLIINSLDPYKLTTVDIIINDPVYMAVDLGIAYQGETLTPDIGNETTLQITIDPSIQNNIQSIRQQVNSIFTNYFSNTKDNLGLLINFSDLSTQILEIEGVINIQTVRGFLVIPGISLLLYNPVYPNADISIVQQNTQLQYFQFPYLNNSLDFINKINVVANS
jgi:hypothetical protein